VLLADSTLCRQVNSVTTSLPYPFLGMLQASCYQASLKRNQLGGQIGVDNTLTAWGNRVVRMAPSHHSKVA
jgi:hypothetical protein